MELSLNIYSAPVVDLRNAKPTTASTTFVQGSGPHFVEGPAAATTFAQGSSPLAPPSVVSFDLDISSIPALLVSFAEIIDAIVSGTQNEWWCGSKVLQDVCSQIAALWSKSYDVEKGTFDSHSLDYAIVNVTVDFESGTFALSNPLAFNIQREKLKPPLPILLCTSHRNVKQRRRCV